MCVHDGRSTPSVMIRAVPVTWRVPVARGEPVAVDPPEARPRELTPPSRLVFVSAIPEACPPGAGILRSDHAVFAAMERAFLTALRCNTDGGDDVTAALDALLMEPVPGNGISHYLRDGG
jgi:hypothetical protein